MSTQNQEDGRIGKFQQLALAHMESLRGGGHWWDRHEDAEPPEWYVKAGVRNPSSPCCSTAPQRCEATETPSVSGNIEWSEYRWYNCTNCRWPCIERSDSAAAEADRCWHCFNNDDELPDGNAISTASD